jgi:hypothetical protein
MNDGFVRGKNAFSWAMGDVVPNHPYFLCL